MECFLYDRDLRHERVKDAGIKIKTLVLSCKHSSRT